VIACVGETLEDRKADRTMDVVIRQMKPIVGAFSVLDAKRVNFCVLSPALQLPLKAIGVAL